jgi:uncharacterized protein (DUF2235 family)
VGSVGVVNHFKTFPFTRHNPEIDIVRHAVSIDERRCFFRDNLMEKSWDNPAQDVKNVWFPGVHSDVGGGYPAQEAGLAMGAFEWMLREAIAAQLLVDDAALAAVRAATVPPDASGELHKSLHGGWWLAEFIPKRVWSPQKKGHVWQWKPNLPRSIADGSTLHATYLARLKAVNGYRPVNLPHDEPVVRARFAIEP